MYAVVLPSWEGVRLLSGLRKVGGGAVVRLWMMEGRPAVQVEVWGLWRVGWRPGGCQYGLQEVVGVGRSMPGSGPAVGRPAARPEE